jgi:hypothetical protein
MRGREATLCDPRHIVRRPADLVSDPTKKIVGQVEADIMFTQIGHWLEYDEVAFAVLVIGIATVELLILGI